MALVPLIVHLQPPSGLWHLSIDRFSPYFFQPSTHNITNVRPLPVYNDFFPAGADIARIAYHFFGDYPSDTHRYIDLLRELNAKVRTWNRAWQQGYRKRPELKLCRHEGLYLLVDTRGLPGTELLRELDTSEAGLLMDAKPYSRSTAENLAIDRKLAVVVDDWFVPLPVARREIFLELTAGLRNRAASVSQRTKIEAGDLHVLIDAPLSIDVARPDRCASTEPP
jgi:hypothetical protein